MARIVSLQAIPCSRWILHSQLPPRNIQSFVNVRFNTNDTFAPGSNSLETIIFSSSTTNRLIDVVKQNTLTGNQASLLLTRLAQLQNGEPIPNFTTHPVFKEIYTAIGNEKYTITTESLVLSLINTCRLATEPNNPFISILEPECRRRLRVMQIRHLIFLMTNHNVLLAVNSLKLQDLVKEAACILETRLQDIVEVKNLSQLLLHSRSISESLPTKLENHIASLMEYFSFSDLTLFCKAMVAGQFPSGILHQKMSIKMTTLQEEWTVKQVLDVLKCFSASGFNNRTVIIVFGSYLQSQIENCNRVEVLDIVRIFKSGRVANKELLDQVAAYVVKNMAKLSCRDLRYVLQAFFELRYAPEDEFVDVVTEKLLSQWTSLKPYLQVELAWCMMGMNRLSTILLQKVLRLNEDGSGLNTAVSIKHQHLITYAKMECSSTVDTNQVKPVILHRVNQNKDGALRPLQQGVKTALEGVLEGNNLFAMNVLTPTGHVIDAELLLDALRNPVDLQNQEAMAATDITRVALLIHGPTSHLYASDQLVGPVMQKRRQLKAAGYILAEIGFREWNNMKSDEAKNALLRTKLNIC